MIDPLDTLAARAESDPFFLAWPLAAYARGEQLDAAGLAAALGCRPEDLTRVRLCRAPRSEPPEFWEDVTRIAERFGLVPQRLAEIVKRGRVLGRWQTGQAAASASLLAARDRDEESSEKRGQDP